MSLTPLPAQGSTAWYGWATDVHAAAAEVNTGRLSDTGLSAAFGPLPDAYLDARLPSDGAITALTRGQFISSFGNSPAVIASGAIEHTILTSTNSAAYIQAQLSDDVARIGCLAEWDATATGAVAVVVPTTPWSQGGIGTAGMHLTINAAGSVLLGRYQGDAVTNLITGTVGTLTGTGTHRIEAVLDYRRSMIDVLIDGVRVIRRADATAFGLMSSYAIWELFETSNTLVPARLLSVWANTETRVPVAAPIGAPPQVPGVGYVLYSPTTQLVAATTTSSAAVDATNAKIIVTYGPTGKALLEIDAYYEFTGTETVFMRFSGSPFTTTRAALKGAAGESKNLHHVTEVTGGTPGATTLLTLQHWGITGGLATLKAGGSGGGLLPPLVIKATPV